MTDIVINQGKFVYLSYYSSSPYPFDQAIITYNNGLTMGLTWDISSLSPNRVYSQLNLTEITSVQLLSSGSLVAQYSPVVGGATWTSANLNGSGGQPMPNYVIAWDPAVRAIVLTDQDIVPGSGKGGHHHHH